MSYEGGVKFDRKGLSGSAFVFRNELTKLLAVGVIGFFDFDQNGTKDGFDFDILTNRNIGEAVIKGYELETRYAAANGLSVWAHYAASDATDSLTGEPLAFVPGGAGAAGVRYALEWKRRPWAELVWRHQAAQNDVTPPPPGLPVPGYARQQIFSGRGTPPVEHATDEEVLLFVRNNRGAIGYVSESAPTDGVKVVEVR